MANERTDPLTLSIGGISVTGKLKTDLDTGIGKWYPISGPTGPFPVLGDKYLTSTKDANGNWTGWTPVNDAFEEIRNQNSQISAAYGTTDKLATAFYISGTGVGSPTGTLNRGRLNQFNTYGASQTAKNLKIPGTTNTATTTPTPTPTPTDLTPEKINDPNILIKEGLRKGYDNYCYPESLRKNEYKQDIIKFTAFSYEGRQLTLKESSGTSFGTPGFANRQFKRIEGSVTLPIQPSITDINAVQWGSEDLNPLQAFGASASYGAATDIGLAAQQAEEQISKLFKQSNFSNSARIFLAGKAVGVNGLLSRVGGGVLNPNMELLFQGPQLRPFSFTFRLSPRDETEAQQVKYIIRFFKENMSVKNTPDNIFLKAPNVFQINYKIKGEKDHPSLNRIKVCALQSCSVDYTPDGSYMTFNDENATMTSYSLSLQFQELEPVTAEDYSSNGYNQGDLSYAKVNEDVIGY